MNPYEALPAKAFWKTAVAENNMFEIEDLWDPKFHVRPRNAVATYGSCFAQHIGRALDNKGYTWVRSEQPPLELGDQNRRLFNYDLFSSRTGNIYTTSLLLQWAEWAFGLKPMPEEIWQQGDRFFDPFRPAIEPKGFASVDELRASQAETLRAFRASVEDARFFVFTLGLTERWVNGDAGYEYPMCPGTVGGEFDEQVHLFEKMEVTDVAVALGAALDIFQAANPKLKFILTVSPVPLTATNSGKHVLVATMQSKAILRAAAGQLADKNDHIDYFPSYEIISSPVFRGEFFEPNLRQVTAQGVSFVMDSFFRDMAAKYGKSEQKKNRRRQKSRGGMQAKKNQEEIVCEEQLLAAFGKKP